MAQRNTSGRGATATKTRSSGRGEIRESDLAQLTAEDIRSKLRKRGVSGISALRKDELVKRLASSLRAEGRRESGPARQVPAKKGPANQGTTKKAVAKKAAAKKTAARTTAAKKVTAKKVTAKKAPAKRAVAKTAPAKKTVAKTTAKKVTAKKAPAKKAPAKRVTAAQQAPARKAATKRMTAPTGGQAAGAGEARAGGTKSRSLKYAQPISSPAEQPERPGRSLVTSSHDVIQQWAEARNAKPATIAGTEREGRAGVLTFNFPGYRESDRIQEISWDDWFATFDIRGLNFIYQEQMSDGRQSNFFRTESPEREDA